MKISERLASQEDFSNPEIGIANYILDHKEAVLRMPAQEICRANMLKIDELILTVPFPGEHDALADILTDKDCAIVVSYSGNTKAVFDQVKILRRHRVPIIAVTSDPVSMIGRHAKITLPMPVFEDKWNKQATFSSQTATEYVLNVLYSCIYVRKFGQSSDRRMRNIEEHRDTRF